MAQTQCTKTYKRDKVSIQYNRKTGEAGTIDIYKGCPGCELRNLPCYAAKGAARVGINFFSPVKRDIDLALLKRQLQNYDPAWIRIGCISDPSLSWSRTLMVCSLCKEYDKAPVIVTKLHEDPDDIHLQLIKATGAMLQISMSALARNSDRVRRISTMIRAAQMGMKVACRINTATFKEGSRLADIQNNIVEAARNYGVPLLETPIRLFQTSPLWNQLDQSEYHRHMSTISGKLDNQRTSGLLLSNSYPCFSTCAPGPSGNDPVGCPHQCLTVGKDQWKYLEPKTEQSISIVTNTEWRRRSN